ncbi:MAG: TIR domain-containing protein [Paracoccaceae bacterium]|nr:TIR domain-containing protein [Paracoccaceae bacterium]
MGRIFISHQNNSADNSRAEKIHRWIKNQKGINGFLDFDIQDGLQVGQQWEDEIYAAIRSAQVVIAIVSNDWLKSHWCTSEARMARLLGLKLILIIAEECEVPFRDTQSIRLEKHGEIRAFEELRQALRTTHKLPDRPYPGLAAFDEKDAAVFFGREDETRDLVNKVNSLFKGRPKTPRMLLVLGASGSGKSSLMRAGFLPEFKADPENLCIGPIIPGGDALDEIAEVLDAPLDGLDAEAMADAIAASMKCANQSYKRAVICIDQAEELLEEERDSTFFDVMRALLEKRRGRVVVLATMRSDFLNEFQKNRLIGPDAKLAYETMALDPLPEDHLGAIIRQPAELFGVKYENKLFARICKDHKGPDALPLLAFFLDEFWRRDFIRDGVLQLSEYKEFGGVGQALEKAKDRAIKDCARLDAAYDDRQVLLDDVREVFLGLLVSINAASGAAVRNRAPASALSERQTALLMAFANQRLLILKNDMWEVVHEALLRQWTELEKWVAEARDDLVAIARIEAAAANWTEANENESDVTHGGDRLDTAVRLLASPRYADRFDGCAKAYIEACQAKETERYEQEKKHLEELEQQKAGAEAEARRALRSQRLSLAALSSTALKSGRPDEAAYLALAAWPRKGSDFDDLSEYGTVVLNALAAALPALREIRRFPLGAVGDGSWFYRDLAVSSDGIHIALKDDNNQFCVCRLHNDGSISRHELKIQPKSERFNRLTLGGYSFSPDTRTFVVRYRWYDEDGSSEEGWPEYEKVLDLDEIFGPSGRGFAGDGPGPLPERKFFLRYAFETSGWELADRETGELIKPVPTLGQILLNEFHRGDAHITYVDDENRIWLWALAEDEPREILKSIPKKWEFTLFEDRLETAEAQIVLSPDGAFVAIWVQHKVQVFECVSERELVSIDRAHTTSQNWEPDYIIGSFSPCGSLFASLSFPIRDTEEVQVRLWDLRRGSNIAIVPKAPDFSRKEQPLKPRRATDRSVRDIRCSTDGKSLAAVVPTEKGVDVVRWNLEDGRRTASLELSVNTKGEPPDVVLSPDCTLAVVAAITKPYTNESDGSESFLPENNRVIEIASGNEISVMETVRYNVRFIGEGPLYTDRSSLSVSLHDIRSGQDLITLYPCLDGEWQYPNFELTGLVGAAAFSPDGSSLVTYEQGVSLVVDDDGDGDRCVLNPFGPQVRFWTIRDGHARLWSEWQNIDKDLFMSKPYPTGVGGEELESEALAIGRLLFSPRGEMVALIGGRDHAEISFHDPASGERFGKLRFADEAVDGFDEIAFTPDGSRLAVPTRSTAEVAQYGTGVSLYDVGTGQRVAYLPCPGGFSRMTIAPDGNHIFVGQGDGSILGWNVAYGTGTLFDIVYRVMPVLTSPAIASEFGMALEDQVHSSKEPLPNDVPVPRVKAEEARDLALGYRIPAFAKNPAINHREPQVPDNRGDLLGAPPTSDDLPPPSDNPLPLPANLPSEDLLPPLPPPPIAPAPSWLEDSDPFGVDTPPMPSNASLPPPAPPGFDDDKDPFASSPLPLKRPDKEPE